MWPAFEKLQVSTQVQHIFFHLAFSLIDSFLIDLIAYLTLIETAQKY